jgi:hypothetical protein
MADSSETPSSYTDPTLADTASPWDHSNTATYADASVNANPHAAADPDSNAATYTNPDTEADPDSTSNPNSPSKQGYWYAAAS